MKRYGILERVVDGQPVFVFDDQIRAYRQLSWLNEDDPNRYRLVVAEAIDPQPAPMVHDVMLGTEAKP